MKRISMFFVAFIVMATTFASVAVEAPPKKANEIFIPIGNSGKKISLMELSQISVKEFEALSGRNMKTFDELSFKLAQSKLRKSINKDGSVNSKKLNKMVKKADGTDGFHLGGFALGFLLGLIGVLIAYLLNDDKKKTRVKWAWLGVAAWLVLFLIIVLI